MKKPILLFTMALVALTIACSKLQESPDPVGQNPTNQGSTVQQTSYSTFNEFLQANSVATETLKGDPSQALDLKTKDGAHILVYPNSLVDMDGNIVSGEVSFTITEYNTKEAMILGKVETLTTNGEILESGGMYDIKVTQNGKPLRVRDGYRYGVEFPNTDANMDPYMGEKGPDGTMQWVKNTDWVKGVDSTTFKNSMYMDSFTFSNLDRLKNIPNKTTITIIPDPSQKDIVNSVNLIFKSSKSVCYLPRDGDKTYTTGNYYNVPEGETVHMLIMGFEDGYLYWYDFEHTIGNNESIQLPVIEKISESDFKARIKNLN